METGQYFETSQNEIKNEKSGMEGVLYIYIYIYLFIYLLWLVFIKKKKKNYDQRVFHNDSQFLFSLNYNLSHHNYGKVVT